MNDELNMSIRKFLKQVGVTSQQQIESGWRDKGSPEGVNYKVKAVLTIEDLDIEHTIESEITDGLK